MNSFCNVFKNLCVKTYWNRTNFAEFIGFTIKLSIIIPGLLFNRQWWWLYIFALISSLVLIVTSIKKNLPTIIYFNLGWTFVASFYLIKHFQ